MKWQKLGRIFCPDGEYDWMHSHAANPVADHIGADDYRIYFSTRDANSRSSIAWLEIDLRTPLKVIRVAREPVLRPGDVGTFDDSGCSIGSIVRDGQRRLIYYMGWNLGVTVPWRNSIGLAISDDGEHFKRFSMAPLMDRSETDPYTISYPWVLRSENQWHLWYGSHLRWGTTDADMFHMIKYATSSDGCHWSRDGKVLINCFDESEYAFARPCVLKYDGRYRMWYSYRGAAYRIGYAESDDGVEWVRRDSDVGIAPSPGEWDGECIEYPCVFSHGDETYLLYCGNGYGKSGFGIAVLMKE
jgi:predicted GH43/DUF377 family glycosyl hydrolase